MKEQIEKLKCDLEQCHREFVTDGDVYTDYAVTAKGLIEKGWRKQSDVAMEIFEEIEKCTIRKVVRGGEIVIDLSDRFAELKKKYVDGGAK